MNPLKVFEKLCDPAKLYVMLSFVSVVVYMVHFMGKRQKKYSLKELGLQVGLMFIWTVVLQKVCSFKYGVKISWFLVFLPVLFMILVMILAFKMMDELDVTKDDIHLMLDKIQKGRVKGDVEDDVEGDLEGFRGCG